MTSLADIRALATRLFDAIEAGDIDDFAGCYASDVKIWHNTDGATQTKDANLKTLSGFMRAVPERRYAGRRLDVFDGGFVQRHTLCITSVAGATAELAACVVCEVKDGLITRLDEYFDSAQVAALTKTAGG